MIQIFACAFPSHEYVLVDGDGMFGKPWDITMEDLVHPYHVSSPNMMVSQPLVKQDCSPKHLLALVSNVGAHYKYTW